MKSIYNLAVFSFFIAVIFASAAQAQAIDEKVSDHSLKVETVSPRGNKMSGLTRFPATEKS